MRNLVIRLLINAAALWAAARWVTGIELSGSVTKVLFVALIFGLVNAVIRPIVRFFSFPLIILTLGLFTFVINAGMLWLTAQISSSLFVAGPRAALMGALTISVVSWALSVVAPDGKKDKD